MVPVRFGLKLVRNFSFVCGLISAIVNIARMLALELIQECGVGFLVFWFISSILNIDSSKSSQLGWVVGK